MEKTSKISIRIPDSLLDKLNEEYKTSEKNRTEIIIEILESHFNKASVGHSEIEVEVNLIKISELAIENNKPIMFENIINKERVINEMKSHFFNDLSWEIYILWLLYHYSAITGVRLDNYIEDHLKNMKRFPLMVDLLRNFPNLRNIEFDYLYAYFKDKDVRDLRDFKRLVSKIEELSFQQIKGFCKSNDIE